MAKSDSQFVCQQCGHEEHRWHGKCPMCNEWGSLVETTRFTKKGKKVSKSGKKSSSNSREPVNLKTIKSSATKRLKTKLPELDRVLGGGIVPGQVVLIAGEPGIGKSTILLQLAQNVGNALYVSGEESAHQVALRAKRLGVTKRVNFLEEVDVDTVIDSSESETLLIVDSIQTMATTDLSGMAGSVGQVKECAYRLVRLAKSKNLPIFVVGHVTKQGSVAGPSVLMHIVDTVLWFEGEKISNLRLLRANKNRFGPTDEVGIFSMEEKGLISVKDAKVFLSKIRKSLPGSTIGAVMKGTRPLLVEVQALVSSTKLAFPRRTAQGIDSKRLELLIAVLSKRCGLRLGDYDCFVKISGGLRADDPSLDLAICLAIASSYFDKALGKKFAVGEVGLLGEIRPTPMQTRMEKEARRLGFSVSKNSNYLSQIVRGIKD